MGRRFVVRLEVEVQDEQLLRRSAAERSGGRPGDFRGGTEGELLAVLGLAPTGCGIEVTSRHVEDVEAGAMRKISFPTVCVERADGTIAQVVVQYEEDPGWQETCEVCEAPSHGRSGGGRYVLCPKCFWAGPQRWPEALVDEAREGAETCP